MVHFVKSLHSLLPAVVGLIDCYHLSSSADSWYSEKKRSRLKLVELGLLCEKRLANKKLLGGQVFALAQKKTAAGSVYLILKIALMQCMCECNYMLAVST